MTTTVAPVLLGGYPAKQCPRRTHNDFDPTVPPPMPMAPALLERLAAGRDFEDVVVADLVAGLGDRCVSIVYGDHRADKARRIAETVAAMEAGVPVIVGGQLPDDTVGGRTGSPDVLFRATAEGEPARYVPGDIKQHLTVKTTKRTSVSVSGLHAGYDRCERAGYSHMTGYRSGDAMQLAHYTRMLQARDRHPGEHLLVGAILGTSDFTALTGTRYGFVWYDLTAATEKTYSASAARGWVKRSILDCYDHEFALRQRVAAAARSGGLPVVQAYGKAECGDCGYLQWCAEQAGPEDASFAISRGQLTDREWRYLHQQGLGSITALATAQPHGELLAGFTKAAAGLPAPDKRLGEVIRRARMHRDGVALEYTADFPLVVPTADVEIDFDVEWHPGDGHVYQWGARVRYGAREETATYAHTAVSFVPLTAESAASLADEFFTWLEGFVADHERAGRTVKIFHWTTPETTRALAMLGPDRAAALFTGRFVDLKKFLADRYLARDGFSIKVIAPLFGFTWRVDDAGGLMSVTKIEEARHATDPQVAQAARDWLWVYNEDDCAAQAAIRDGLHAFADGRPVPDRCLVA